MASGVFSSQCSKCSAFITNVEASPANTVSILQKGVEVFRQLNDLEATVLDAEQNTLPITKYDIVLQTRGTGRTTSHMVIPMVQSTAPLPDGLKKYDLDAVVLKLDANEITSVLRGVSLKDIFQARKANQGADAVLREEEESLAEALGDYEVDVELPN